VFLAPTFVAGATALDTPALVLDLEAFDSNVRAFLPRHGAVKVRPHLKSAKSVEAAQRVMAAGAAGICVAKLSEAEIMLAGGLPDVLITTEIVSARKAERLAAAVLRHPMQRLTTVVDSAEGVEVLERALTRAGAAVDVLIDVDVGQRRCGVIPHDAPALAQAIATCPSLRLVGVQGYEGHLQHVRRHAERRSRCAEAMAHLGEAVGALARSGYSVETVTTGGTGTSTFCARHEVVTEVQPDRSCSWTGTTSRTKESKGARRCSSLRPSCANETRHKWSSTPGSRHSATIRGPRRSFGPMAGPTPPREMSTAS
jgi:D-serine deaminase-like pyridoxal phosphate-dependent protein